MNMIVNKPLNLSGKDVLLNPFDLDFSRRVINLTGEIDDVLSSTICSALRELKRSSEDDITLYIQSPGGSVSAGFYIYDTIKALNCDVKTVACGMCASMASIILAAAGTKGKRYCQPNAEILIHQPLGGTSGQATDIRIHAEHIMNTRNRLNTILAQCTGQSIEKINNDTERDHIMSANEAKNYGLVDIVGDPITEH